MSATSSKIHRAFISFGVLLTILGVVFVPQVQAAPTTLIDNLVDGGYKSTNNVYLAQSFNSDSNGGSLSEVSLMYRGSNESNTGASASSIDVFLYSSSLGQPSQQLNLLGTRAVSAWSNETYTISLGTPVQLTASTQYFIVVKGTSSGTAVWKFTNSQPSSFIGSTPTAFTSNNASSWTSLTNTFFSLKVSANPPASLPQFGEFSNQEFTYGDSSASITEPTSSAAGSWSYSSSDNSVVSISGSTMNIVGAGVAIITASFTPTDTLSYLAGSLQATVIVMKSSPVLTGETDPDLSTETWPATIQLPS